MERGEDDGTIDAPARDGRDRSLDREAVDGLRLRFDPAGFERAHIVDAGYGFGRGPPRRAAEERQS